MAVFEDEDFDLEGFARFLAGAGFRLVYRNTSSPHFGNVLVTYANSAMKVRIVRDRSNWTLEVADPSNDDLGGGYDMWLFQELLLGIRSDNGMSIDEKVAFFKQHLPRIVDAMSGDKAKDTMSKLDELGLARFKRLIPELGHDEI
jgi:hypothetical protein